MLVVRVGLELALLAAPRTRRWVYTGLNPHLAGLVAAPPMEDGPDTRGDVRAESTRIQAATSNVQTPMMLTADIEARGSPRCSAADDELRIDQGRSRD